MERERPNVEIPQDTNFVIIDFIPKSRKTGIPVLNPDVGLYISVIQTKEQDKTSKGIVFIPTLIGESDSLTHNVAIHYSAELNFDEIYCYVQDIIYKWYSKKSGKLEVIIADFINSNEAEMTDFQRLPFDNAEEKRRREIHRILRRCSPLADIDSIFKIIERQQVREKAGLN